MKKKVTMLTAGALCAASVTVGAIATTAISEIRAELRPDFTIEIDGQVREFKNAKGEVIYPVLYEGTTYLPVRAIGEIMGKTVFWYEDEKRVELRDTTVTDADVIVGGSGGNTGSASTMVTPPSPVNQTGIVDPSALIGGERAKEIALEKAGLTAAEVIFDRVELDEDDGRIHYEVEFRKGRIEYDADIAADDGTVLSWEVDSDN